MATENIAKSLKRRDRTRRWYDQGVTGQWHEIPFRNGTVGAVPSYAVFEHLHNPYLSAAEELVYRFGRAFPFLAPRNYFPWPDQDRKVDELHRAAGIAFMAEKIET